MKILKQWTRPGFDLGNHRYSHVDFDPSSIDDSEQEIMRGKTAIGPLLRSVSRKPNYFRFPYNHTGDTKEKHEAIATFLAARGYQLAPCTINNSDYEIQHHLCSRHRTITMRQPKSCAPTMSHIPRRKSTGTATSTSMFSGMKFPMSMLFA
jgi:hypothetical protein